MQRTRTQTDDTAKEEDPDTSVLMILPTKRTRTHTDDTADAVARHLDLLRDRGGHVREHLTDHQLRFLGRLRVAADKHRAVLVAV